MQGLGMRMPPRGIMVAACGGEGSGKSSVAAMLAESLRSKGYDVVLTREPGGSPAAEAIRGLLVSGETDRFCGMAEVLLFAAARVEHLRQTVLPALEAGKVVVCDRFISSTLAYQGGGHGIDPQTIAAIHRLTTGNLHPDITLFFDVTPEIGLARSTKRLAVAGSGEDRFEKLDLAFHQRVHATYKQLARQPGWVTLDAGRPMEEVLAQAVDAALTLLVDVRHMLGAAA